MAWANQKLYQACEHLPEEALGSFIVNPEWTAAKILQHIVSGADWYVYCLGIAPWHDIPLPISVSEISELTKSLAKFDAQIYSAYLLDDELITFNEENRQIEVTRSMLLSEAVLHATEHRAQLMDAVESRGFSALSLDSIDLWSYETWIGSSGQN